MNIQKLKSDIKSWQDKINILSEQVQEHEDAIKALKSSFLHENLKFEMGDLLEIPVSSKHKEEHFLKGYYLDDDFEIILVFYDRALPSPFSVNQKKARLIRKAS